MQSVKLVEGILQEAVLAIVMQLREDSGSKTLTIDG